MNRNLLHKMFWIPLFILGVVLLLLGPRWMIVEEPWLLDKIANEEALGMSFDNLFNESVNKTLPDYLRIIYRFFGLWITGLGIMICAYLLMVDLELKKSRYTILTIITIILGISLIYGHVFIPSSPFIYLMWGLVLLYIISLIASIQINPVKE